MNRIFQVLFFLAMFGAAGAEAQLSATDNFEGYVGNPVGAGGGTGDWTSLWGYNAETGGGVYLSAASKIDGTQCAGLYGMDSASGRSISRAFPPCTNLLTIQASIRADYSVTNISLAPTGNCRMAFTIRVGNDASHFSNQRLSFFFAAGVPFFMWYDGQDRTSTVPFVTGHIYDLRVVMNPTNRAYSFVMSNRNNSATYAYAGSWSLGASGDPMGSVAFLMRGPSGAGNDAFLDSVSVEAPDYLPPAPPSLPIREGDLWRYWKGTSTPPLQGTNQWYRPEFDDASWGGPAPSGFGYADCDDATTLGDMEGGYLALFTRKSFVVTNPAAIAHLTLAADYDDGLIAYLNGVEIARLNMPTGAVTRHTAAAGNHESSRGQGASNPNPKEYYTIDPSLLVAGTNVIAVAGHNVSTNSSDFSLIVELYTNVALVRGPFIQMPTHGPTVAIAWQTAALADSVVEYGLDMTYGSGTVSNGTLTRDHTIHLTGLLPGTSYYYRVRSGGETLIEGMTFRTRPAPDQSFRFVVIGDHGQGTPQMYSIAARINARTDFDAVMTVGDNVYGAVPCNLDGMPGWYDPFWFQLYAPTMRRVVTFPTLGNHDWDTASGQYMVDYFRLPTNGPVNHIGKNYSFEFGNIHGVVIDTEPYADNNTLAMAEIDAWLAADLASATQRWRLAFLHRPPYTTPGGHDDQPQVKARIVPLLSAAGVQIVFQGHNHWYERINPINGIHYITTAGAGAGLYVPGTRKEYSAVLYSTRHSYTVVDVQGGRLALQQFNDLDEVIDEFQIDLDHPFAIDGLLDNPTWLRASNGLNLFAAIRGPYLYVATQDAGEGSDHFIYMADRVSTQQPANWSKSGTVMQWSAFLADENDSAYYGWFDANGAALTNVALYKATTSGLNNNGTNGNGVLEGSIDLAAHLGAFPQQLYLAAAPFTTTNSGHLLSAFQVPIGDGNGNLESNEFLLINTRDLALDLPIPLIATNAPVEAGMHVSLDGSASASPSGLPLSFTWSQAGGPPGLFSASHSPISAFWITQQVASVQTVLVTLAVHDGRFTETTNHSVIVYPMADTDGDGLSDQEEITGSNNVLTPANPDGRVTNPLLADSDGDHMNDGQEAISGTDPNDSASRFELVSVLATGAPGVRIQWSSSTGRFYSMWSSTNLFSSWTLQASNLPGTPPVNTFTNAPPVGAADFFAIEVVQP